MMVERYPNLREDVGGSLPGYEISPLYLTKKKKNLVLACRPLILNKFAK